MGSPHTRRITSTRPFWTSAPSHRGHIEKVEGPRVGVQRQTRQTCDAPPHRPQPGPFVAVAERRKPNESCGCCLRYVIFSEPSSSPRSRETVLVIGPLLIAVRFITRRPFGRHLYRGFVSSTRQYPGKRFPTSESHLGHTTHHLDTNGTPSEVPDGRPVGWAFVEASAR